MLTSGRWTITDKKKSTHVVLTSSGALPGLLPSLMKAIVPPSVLGEHEKLIENNTSAT